MQPHVERREVEPEELDHPFQVGDTTVGHAAAAVRREARADHRQVGEQLLGALVAVVPEAPPHEGELPAVRLELVAGADLGRVAGQFGLVRPERCFELVRDADERAGRGELDRECAHLVAVAVQSEPARAFERLRDRGRPRGRVAVQIATDPRAERDRRWCAG